MFSILYLTEGSKANTEDLVVIEARGDRQDERFVHTRWEMQVQLVQGKGTNLHVVRLSGVLGLVWEINQFQHGHEQRGCGQEHIFEIFYLVLVGVNVQVPPQFHVLELGLDDIPQRVNASTGVAHAGTVAPKRAAKTASLVVFLG